MVVKGKTTESSRRHAFSSFRERIESIKIEPNLNLITRAHDYVETSHFLATLEHWKEINISGNFTEFLEKAEPISQTLAQLLHHQNTIFDALFEHIQKNDANSIQPLLEILAQFIHDLGPDFMIYYQRFLDLLTALALATNPNDKQNTRNSSNTLEWVFNCLAFGFKYLAKYLIVDLLPTFKTLMPMLKLTKKVYISRFCSEALSFLIRKLKIEGLDTILRYSFNEQAEVIEVSETYRESLTILYAEAMKNTKGTFHSKSSVILSKIVQNALNVENVKYHSDFISITTDILLEIISHGTLESCTKFHELVCGYLKESASSDNATLLTISQLLTTLSFADSGYKISDWNVILDVVNKLIETIEFSKTTTSTELCESLQILFVTLFRNCDFQVLTKNHKQIIDFMSRLNNGEQFLVFIESCCNTTNSKISQFGISKYVQDFINKAVDLKKVAFFLSRMERKNYYEMPAPILSQEIQKTVVGDLVKNYSRITSPTDLKEIYWRLLLLKHGQTVKKNSLDGKYLSKLLDLLVDNKSKFSNDVLAAALSSLAVILKDSDDKVFIKSIFNKIVPNFTELKESSLFIEAFNRFVVNCQKYIIPELTQANLLFDLAKNLYLPNHESRLNAIDLLISIHEILKLEISSYLSQIRIIEQIPLALSTGRDIELRVRNLSSEYKKQTKVDEFNRTIVIYYMFGLLSNRFQPCWTAVFEMLPLLLGKSTELLWELTFRFLKMNYEGQDLEYNEETLDGETYHDSTLIDWQSRDTRVKATFTYMEEGYFTKYRNLDDSIIAFSKESRADNTYSAYMRCQAIQVCSHVPSIAESHSRELVPFILDGIADSMDADEDETSISSWTLKDRNDLIAVFGKFKKLNKMHDSDKMYQLVLDLLCHTQPAVQKIALNVITHWGIKSINKYKDNLLNLLDETIFRDEMSKFIRKDIESDIEELDLPELMPIVLRILFGRVQGASKSNSKGGKKFAVVSMLPNLTEENIIEFLSLGSEKLKYKSFFADNTNLSIDKNELRRTNGYVNLLDEVYSTLGNKYANALSTTIQPLVYSLVLSQQALETELETIQEKTARSIRSTGMKCLNKLFKTMGETFNWDDHLPTIYDYLIKPRMEKFAVENLQQPSSLMKIILNWIELPNNFKFLYVDDFTPVILIISLLSATNAKESVVMSVLQFIIHALSKKNVTEDKYFTLLALIVEALLKNLPTIIDNISSRDVGKLAIDILLLLVEGQYIDSNETKSSLLVSLTKSLENRDIDSYDKIKILQSLSSLIDGYDCSFEEIEALYDTCAKCFRIYADGKIRTTLVEVFNSIGRRFVEYEQVSELLAGLNAFSSRRIQEYDFERRLSAFKAINEELYTKLTAKQWLPIIYSSLFFINDPNELAIRTNASYLLRRFIDGVAQTDSSDVAPYLSIFKDIVIPNLRGGLKKLNEDIQTEFISVLEHAVQSSNHFDELNDMQVLIVEMEDEEDVGNFFNNVNHIQMYRRLKAIKNLIPVRNQLKPTSIAQFILPIIEHYALSKEDKFNSVGVQTMDTISHLLRCVTWQDFRSIFKRYISNLRGANEDMLKKHVNMVVLISNAFMVSVRARKDGSTEDLIKGLPEDQQDIDNYVLKEIFPTLLRILNLRNDDTIVARAPLSEAMCCLIMTISPERIDTELPSILTSTCQVMRSRSEELRDAIRKSLCKILKTLGQLYLKFVLQELKTALSRGSQIHVLSFTVHHLVSYVSSMLSHGDLDEPLPLIVEVVMEDIFGAAGQEKDAEGYHSKMKEVKFKKSFDTGEIITANINLSSFGIILGPIKRMLMANMSLKTQTKMDELIRRFTLGLNHNNEAGNPAILVLCYEIYKQAFEVRNNYVAPKPIKESEDHFLVKLDAKPKKAEMNSSLYQEVLQKIAFEMLRTAISRHASLLSVANLAGFLPLLEESLRCENEGVVASALRILNTVIKLPFSKEEDEIFTTCTSISLNIIKDSPSTNADICQAALKFLATVIRHKPDVQLTDSAISYILVKIQPDLEEPQRQSLAFNFLKNVVGKHIMIPEIYDVMEKVSNIMVVNSSKEIRDMSRRVFFLFLMEYDQGRGKLEKQFKFFVNNMSYPTESGRQSVMELVHLIVTKSGPDLLQKLASSFFVALANVLAVDDSTKCREMATSLITAIMAKVDKEQLADIEKYTTAWINSPAPQLKSCGLGIYKIYISEFEFGYNKVLDKVAMNSIELIFNTAKKNEENDLEWGLLYAAFSVFTNICKSLKEEVFEQSFENIWKYAIDSLLYPHAWIRLSAARLIGVLLKNLDIAKFDISGYEVQTICYRLIRQLGAPSITEDLGNQIIKNLVLISMRWEENSTLYESKEASTEDAKGEEVDTTKARYEFANDYLIGKTCAIIRQEQNYKFSFISKKSSIKLAAMLIQVAEGDRAPAVAEKVLLAVHNFTEVNSKTSQEEEELVNLTLECMQMMEKKLGVSVYTGVYSKVKLAVDDRRKERKLRKSQMALTAPDLAAKKKLRKHERNREKRKHEKDENGYYKSKRNRFE